MPRVSETWSKDARIVMIRKDINQKKLCELTGLSVSYVSAIINRRIDPSKEAIHKICNVLEIALPEEYVS